MNGERFISKLSQTLTKLSQPVTYLTETIIDHPQAKAIQREPTIFLVFQHFFHLSPRHPFCASSSPHIPPKQMTGKKATAMSCEKATQILEEIGQEWLVEEFDRSEPEREEAFYKQIVHIDAQYPNGLKQYCENATRLLKESVADVNPFKGCTPQVPTAGLPLDYGSDRFIELETVGADQIAQCCFVLVAGGLGERLGYNGVKLELPVEITTETCYLQYYLGYLKAYNRIGKVKKGDEIPLAIMTSEDTHGKTLELLERNGYFGYPKSAVTLMKQEKVPSICDASGRFVKRDKYTLETKPHGHGDVHQLLHSTGLAQKWAEKKRKYILFFQDTNAFTFNTCLGAVGLSEERGLEMNSICIQRKAKEAIGGVTTLIREGQPPLTVSVEYNQLGPLLAEVNGVGDVADESGHSPYPGNINTLVFRIAEYVVQLAKTKGLIAEFVNPKYTDSSKTVFKSPTRLECMMQDYPKTLACTKDVGFTTFSREFAFSPVKNSVGEAVQKVAAGLDANCAASGEADFYRTECRKLSLCGVKVAVDSTEMVYQGVPVVWYPRVVLAPSFAPSLARLRASIVPSAEGSISISARSSLTVEGEGALTVHRLELDGALHIKVAKGARLTIENLKVRNQGCTFTSNTENEETLPEKYVIRGYTIRKDEVKVC